MSLSLKTRPWRPKIIPRSSFRSSIASFCNLGLLDAKLLLKSSSFSPSIVSWARTVRAHETDQDKQ